MEYKIITGSHALDCQQLVRVHIQAGWRPRGGPFVTLDRVHQAMTRKEFVPPCGGYVTRTTKTYNAAGDLEGTVSSRSSRPNQPMTRERA